MPMKKAEMEAHNSQYDDYMAAAQSAEDHGLFKGAVKAAISAWEFIDGMMQYRAKYADAKFSSIPAIDLVLKYAPLLLDSKSLDRLEQLLRERRRIARNTSEDLAEELKAARSQMWENRRLLEYLQRTPDARQEELRKILGGAQDHWRSVAEAWEKMGLIHRMSRDGFYRLSLSTRLGQVVAAKCPSCGNVSEAPKGMFLEKVACPKCRKDVYFVLIVLDTKVAARE